MELMVMGEEGKEQVLPFSTSRAWWAPQTWYTASIALYSVGTSH